MDQHHVHDENGDIQFVNTQSIFLYYLYVFLVKAFVFFFAAFCLHSYLRTPAPIVFKFCQQSMIVVEIYLLFFSRIHHFLRGLFVNNWKTQSIVVVCRDMYHAFISINYHVENFLLSIFNLTCYVRRLPELCFSCNIVYHDISSLKCAVPVMFKYTYRSFMWFMVFLPVIKDCNNWFNHLQIPSLWIILILKFREIPQSR